MELILIKTKVPIYINLSSLSNMREKSHLNNPSCFDELEEVLISNEVVTSTGGIYSLNSQSGLVLWD